MKKLIIYLVSGLLILFVSACGGGGSSGGEEINYEIGYISIEVVDPVLDETTDPDTNETIYITSTDQVYISGKIHRLTDYYTEACSEIENLPPLDLTGTWHNLTSNESGSMHIVWGTIFGTLWDSCMPVFNLNADLIIGNNTIELFVQHSDGYFANEKLRFDNQ